MLKNNKHRLFIVIGVILITSLMVMDFFSNLCIEKIISYLSLGGMIAIFNFETKMSDCQSEILNSINEHLSFQSILFPKSIEKAKNLIQKYNNKVENTSKKYCLNIYTDVPGYAIFSNNKLWNEFFDELKKLKTSFSINWHFYSDTKLKEHIDKQFQTWYKFDSNQIRAEIKSSTNNICKRHAAECTYPLTNTCKSINSMDCKIIQEIYKTCKPIKFPSEMVDFIKRKVINLHEFAIKEIEKLTSEKNVTITRIEKDLPFFAWIFTEEKKHKDKKNISIPIEGIISYSFYNDKNEEREKGFTTCDKKLLEILYEIINSY